MSTEQPITPVAEAAAALPEAAPAPAKPALWRRLASALRTEHFLLAIFIVWSARNFDDWLERLDHGINYKEINAVGFWWVAGPALVMLGIIVLQQLARAVLARSARGAGREAVHGAGKIVLWAADWLPFGLFLSIYLMFRSKLMQNDVVDDELAAVEVAIFRGHAAIWLERFATPTTVLIMQAFYWSHIYFTTPATAVMTYLKDRRLFRALMLGMTVVAVIGALGYYFVPGAGPGHFLHDRFQHDLPTTRLGVVLDMSFNALRAPDDVFPSLHVAISLLCLIEARRTWKWFFRLILPWVVGNWISTVFLRYHYIIDCLAGAALAVAAHYLCHALVKFEERLKNLVNPQAAVPSSE